jgi:ribose 5-phosphate isomerase RpiB
VHWRNGAPQLQSGHQQEVEAHGGGELCHQHLGQEGEPGELGVAHSIAAEAGIGLCAAPAQSHCALQSGLLPPAGCLLTGLLLNSGAADFVVTGCGTGTGSMLAANAMPGVFCGLIIDPTDAFLFGQINDGNAIAMPYAKGFGWAAELNLQDVYRKLFEGERGLGYPKERAEIMRKNRGVLSDLKAVTCHDMLTVLKTMDQDLLKAAIAGEKFQEYFFANATDEGIRDYLKGVLAAKPVLETA